MGSVGNKAISTASGSTIQVSAEESKAFSGLTDNERRLVDTYARERETRVVEDEYFTVNPAGRNAKDAWWTDRLLKSGMTGISVPDLVETLDQVDIPMGTPRGYRERFVVDAATPVINDVINKIGQAYRGPENPMGAGDAIAHNFQRALDQTDMSSVDREYILNEFNRRWERIR